VERYQALAGDFGKAIALTDFGLSRSATEQLFSGYDEDYHISRFFHFSQTNGEKYSINGEAATHVVIDPEIASIL
jgi:hypothetical protein